VGAQRPVDAGAADADKYADVPGRPPRVRRSLAVRALVVARLCENAPQHLAVGAARLLLHRVLTGRGLGPINKRHKRQQWPTGRMQRLIGASTAGLDNAKLVRCYSLCD